MYVADWANFKPAMIAEDNPAAFSYFYDTSGRRTCCLAPERFYMPSEAEEYENPHVHSCKDGPLTPAMDIFAIGYAFSPTLFGWGWNGLV